MSEHEAVPSAEKMQEHFDMDLGPAALASHDQAEAPAEASIRAAEIAQLETAVYGTAGSAATETEHGSDSPVYDQLAQDTGIEAHQPVTPVEAARAALAPATTETRPDGALPKVNAGTVGTMQLERAPEDERNERPVTPPDIAPAAALPEISRDDPPRAQSDRKSTRLNSSH